MTELQWKYEIIKLRHILITELCNWFESNNNDESFKFFKEQSDQLLNIFNNGNDRNRQVDIIKSVSSKIERLIPRIEAF